MYIYIYIHIVIIVIIIILQFVRAEPPYCCIVCGVMREGMREDGLVRHTGVCEQKHSFQASLCPAIQQQKLLCSPWFGALKVSVPMHVTFRRSVFLTDTGTVSFHNFKSRNFKLSVSNPKSKYVAYLFVLSQISNCQSLGRKNKHENLKTDRSTPLVHLQLTEIIHVRVLLSFQQPAFRKVAKPQLMFSSACCYLVCVKWNIVYVCVYTYIYIYIYIYIRIHTYIHDIYFAYIMYYSISLFLSRSLSLSLYIYIYIYIYVHINVSFIIIVIIIWSVGCWNDC